MGYKEAIDWSWGNYGNPGDPCQWDELGVDNNGKKVIRGATHPHDCVRNAIFASRNGQGALAVAWLATTQCHNPPERADIENAGPVAVSYAIERYGKQV